MTNNDQLTKLITKLRSRDPWVANGAAEQLVKEYGDVVKAVARQMLSHWKCLRRLIDPSDVLPSVVILLMRRGMDLPAPQENAEGYLKRAVTNRLRDHGRRFAAQKRDRKREVGIGAASLVAARSVSPSRILGAQEDLTRLLNALDPTQRAVAEARMADIGWEEIADGTDDGSDTIRKRYCRAVKLALQSLGVGAGDGHLTPLE